MLLEKDLQRIIDHFHIGKIQSYSYEVYYYEVITNQGKFFILWDDPLAARDTEDERSEKLVSLVGKVKRV
jgi:hypothetical protein